MKTMDNNITPTDYFGWSLLAIAWSLNMIAIIGQEYISFILGTVVTCMAGYHYFLQIRKAKREEKNNKK